MDEGIEKLDLDDNATKWPDCSKRILDPHDCLGLVAVLWFFAVLGLDTTINHWGLADEHLADEEMMLMAIFLKFLNSLTLLSVLSVSLISRVEKGIPSSFLPTLMVILSERGTTWVFWFRSFSCIGRFLNSQILFCLAHWYAWVFLFKKGLSHRDRAVVVLRLKKNNSATRRSSKRCHRL